MQLKTSHETTNDTWTLIETEHSDIVEPCAIYIYHSSSYSLPVWPVLKPSLSYFNSHSSWRRAFSSKASRLLMIPSYTSSMWHLCSNSAWYRFSRAPPSLSAISFCAGKNCWKCSSRCSRFKDKVSAHTFFKVGLRCWQHLPLRPNRQKASRKTFPLSLPS